MKKLSIKFFENDKLIKEIKLDEFMAAVFTQKITRGNRHIKLIDFNKEVLEVMGITANNYKELIETIEKFGENYLNPIDKFPLKF